MKPVGLKRALGWTLLVLLAAGCAVVPPTPGARPDTAATTTVYVVGRGWHTDIGLPADALPPGLAALRETFPGVRVVVIGFGERAYLTSRDKGAGEMFAALFPGPAAMLVTALRVAPAEAFGADHVIGLHVTQAAYGRIAGFVAASFAQEALAGLRAIGPGPYSGSLFYASTGTYSVVHTCNTWTAEGLGLGGLPFDGDGTLFASQVMAQARAAAAQQGGAEPFAQTAE